MDKQASLESEATIIGSFALDIAKTFEKKGLDVGALFKECGFPEVIRINPSERISSLRFYQLFQRAIEISGNPYLGLECGKHISPVALHALGYSLTASVTLRDFVERLARYYIVVSNNAVMEIKESKEHLVITMDIKVLDYTYQTHDCQAAFLVQFMRMLFRDEFNPSRICLLRDCPEQGDGPFTEYFRCPVEFASEKFQIYLPIEKCDTPLFGGNRGLAALNEKIVADYIIAHDQDDIVTRVNALIMDNISSGKMSKKLIAEQLHMTERTLHNRLIEKETTFQELLDNIRSKLAIGYLERKTLSIGEITFLLGFSDTSVFSKAFKRWFEITPTEYKKKHNL